jgi:predicted nucleotidyltransferase component of viral defense system
MNLQYAKHKSILLQILKDIYTDTTIAPHLGFKGGTAAMLFYNLPRYSADLDFDLLDPTQKDSVFETLQTITAQYGDIREARIKRFSILIVLSHASRAPQIKIEINQRQFGSQYDIQSILGISMLVMKKEDMFAHKLVALYERVGKTSRDIFDVHYFAKNTWPINTHLVEKRTGMKYCEAVQECIKLLENMHNKYILDGLGELLSPAQKDSLRTTLRTDTIFQLRLLLEREADAL